MKTEFMQEQLIEHTSLIMTIAMKHPIIGCVTAIVLSAGGYFVPHLIDVQLPLIVMQVLQISVWSLAGIASYLTIKGYFLKNKK